jgi:FkbM family methyltransferase
MRMMQTLLANVRKHKMDIAHGCRGLVYDLGMNNGDDTAHYLEQGYRVLAVEADPDLVSTARKRFQSSIENGQAIVLNVGISHHCGTATFWICDDNSIWNSFIKERAVRNGLRHHAIEIPVVTLPDLREFSATVRELD